MMEFDVSIVLDAVMMTLYDLRKERKVIQEVFDLTDDEFESLTSPWTWLDKFPTDMGVDRVKDWLTPRIWDELYEHWKEKKKKEKDDE